MRRLLTALLLAIALIGAPGAAPAPAQDTSAVAINTEDGSSLFEFAFDVRNTMKDVVDSTNAAVAYSSCEECQTVAISFQVVLAGGGPSTVTPTNLAIALNENCTTCVTAAFAYQFVVAGDGPMRLTRTGRRQLHTIQRRLRRLERAELPLDQLAAELKRAAQEIRDVLDTELMPAKRDDDDDDERDDEGRPDAAPQANPEPTPTATPPPPEPSQADGTPPPPEPSQADGTPTPTPEATPSATATPTETPAP